MVQHTLLGVLMHELGMPFVVELHAVLRSPYCLFLVLQAGLALLSLLFLELLEALIE